MEKEKKIEIKKEKKGRQKSNKTCPKCEKTFVDARALKKHMENVDCILQNDVKEIYKNNVVIIDGKTKYKCEDCDHIFDDRFAFNKHKSIKKSCKKEKEIREEALIGSFRDKDGKIRYECVKCEKQFKDRYGYTRHANGPRDCKPEYKVETINDRIIIFKNNNKYIITYNNGKKSENLCCKKENCYISAGIGGFCVGHGGERKKSTCTDCDKWAKVVIDGKPYCIFHGGQPKIKQCEYIDEDGIQCDKFIHSSKTCSKHGPPRERDEERVKELREKNIKKKWYLYLLATCKSCDIKKGWNINDKNYITISYIKSLYDISDNKCYWCKREIHTDKGNLDLNQISLDRKNIEKPHLINNIVISCLFCNRGRNATTIENWKKYLDVLKNVYEVDHSNEIFDTYWASSISSRCRQFDKEKKFEEQCDITTEWLREQYKNNPYSHYTGIKMFPSKTKNYPFKISVDRIDNSKGHTKDNIVLCCMAENYGRSNTPFEEFKKWLKENFDIEN